MADINFDNHPQFFTATILEWKHLLVDDTYKDIIINSLLHLRKEQAVKIYAFVIMPNHIHLIWQIQDGFKNVQLRFMKFTAQQFKFRLSDTSNPLLQKFKVGAKDREYQFWERNSLSVDLWSPNVLMQKIDYIHQNPLQDKWRLSDCIENYKYSSAKYYTTGEDEFDLLDHYNGYDLLVTTPTKAVRIGFWCEKMNIFVSDNTNKGSACEGIIYILLIKEKPPNRGLFCFIDRQSTTLQIALYS